MPEKQKAEQVQKRRTYSINPDKAMALSRCSLDMSEQIGQNVPRQAILDALIDCLADKSVYAKVVKIIQNL
jgi:hypothetical protein